MRIRPKHQTNKAFTLVELAVAMTIIGLLIGGVLKGKQFVTNARITATIRQISEIVVSVQTFYDTYSQKPGDMANATARLPNCTPANYCRNGDGNGIIGRTHDDIVAAVDSQAGFDAPDPRAETSMFWKHLTLADLISGVSPSADPTNPAFGVTHPSSHLAGGVHIGHLGFAGLSPAPLPLFPLMATGHYLGFRQSLVGGVADTTGLGGVSPQIAHIIEHKIDDGDPVAGRIIVAGASFAGEPNASGGCGAGPTGPTPMVVTSTAFNCVLFVHVPHL